MSGRLSVVVGGQFGSEGKGAIAGYLTREQEFGYGLAIRVAGPNAGHSVIAADGTKWALRQIPVAAVTNPHAKLAIAAGSEIDPEVLANEASALEAGGYKVWDRLYIDPQATIIRAEHRHAEANAFDGNFDGMNLIGRIGSTGKGIGAARADRIWRRAQTVGDWMDPSAWQLADVSGLVEREMRHHRTDVLVEGTQGYGLGLHAGYYPYCTSSDCRAIDFLAMAGISPWAVHVRQFDIWCAVRPYPIRVAGNSGPLWQETTWEHLGLEPEYTTVTQKMRRVGRWDGQLVKQAVRANGGGLGGSVRLALTMADQLDTAVANTTDRRGWPGTAVDSIDRFIEKVERDSMAQVWLIGTSPSTVIDLREVHQ